MIEEVLKHKSVERCVMVEIDRAVVDIAEQWLPNIHKGAFKDPRMELVIADGFVFGPIPRPLFFAESIFRSRSLLCPPCYSHPRSRRDPGEVRYHPR